MELRDGAPGELEHVRDELDAAQPQLLDRLAAIVGLDRDRRRGERDRAREGTWMSSEAEARGPSARVADCCFRGEAITRQCPGARATWTRRRRRTPPARGSSQDPWPGPVGLRGRRASDA